MAVTSAAAQPEVSDVYFNSDPLNSEYYQPAETVSVTVEFTPAIITLPTCPPPQGATHQCPTLTLQIGDDERTATLVHIDTPDIFPGSTPPALTHSSLDFEYEIIAADSDRLGISIPADGLEAGDVQILALEDRTTAAVLDLAEYAIEDDPDQSVGANLVPEFVPSTVTYAWPVGRRFQVTLPQAIGGNPPITCSALARATWPQWLSLNPTAPCEISGSAPWTREEGTVRVRARDVDGDHDQLIINYRVVDTTVTFSVDPAFIFEGAGGQDIVVTATAEPHLLGALASVSIAVTLAFAGTAAAADYTKSGTETILIHPGGNNTGTTTLTFTAPDDATPEGPETIILNGTITRLRKDVTSDFRIIPAELTINDPLTVTIAPTDVAVAEGESATFTATFSVAVMDAVTVTWDANDDLAGTSYTIPAGTITATHLSPTVAVAIADDELAEGAETVNVTFAVAGAGAVTGAEQVITIAENDPITITVSGPRTHEEGATEDYTATLGGGIHTETVTLTIALGSGGTGQLADVTLPTPATATVAVGDTTAKFAVTMVDDGYDATEVGETIMLTVSGTDAGGATVTMGSTEPITISQLPLVSVTADAAMVDENDGNGGDGSAAFTVSLSSAVDEAVTVTWTVQHVAGNGTADADFGGTAPTGTVTFAPNDTAAQTITVPITNDNLAETGESFNVVLSAPTSPPFGTKVVVNSTPARVTINANDPMELAIRQNELALEGERAEYEVYITNGTVPTADITVTVVVEPTGGVNDATIADDLGTLPPPVTIAAGTTSATFTIAVVDDKATTGKDRGETFRVRMDRATGGGNAATAPAITASMGSVTSTIMELSVISIAPPTPATLVEETAGPVIFTVSLDDEVDTEVMLEWEIVSAAMGGTVPADFEGAVTGTVTLAAGVTSGPQTVDIPVTIADDMLEEGAETFSVVIDFHATSAALAGVKVVIDGDAAAATIGASDNLPPGVPVDFSAEASHNHVTLTWQPPPPRPFEFAMEGYRLQVSMTGNGSDWKDILQPDAGLRTTFTHQPLPVNQELHYRIAARNAIGDGAFSSIIAATTPDYALDFDRYAQVTAEDALALAYLVHVLDSAQSASARDAAVRRTFLGALNEAYSEDDQLLREQLELGQDMKQHGGDSRFDVNDDEVLNADDAIIIYYAITFPELVGDGRRSQGFEYFRRVLLRDHYVGTTEPMDAQLMEMVRRANQLRGG